MSNPYAGFSAEPDAPRSTTTPSPVRVAAALVWAVVVAIVGGLACGWLIMRYGEFGTVGLWGCGAIGGFVARRMTGKGSKPVAIALVIACVLALLLAETWWIRENWNPPPKDWVSAVSKLPEFAKGFQISALVAALFCAFGAHSAWRQMGRRYRLVAVEEP
ncbi:MAG: hypothetical protein HY000_32845 [Planctomycetes bacterium]|nr:hypothetical protein [Planctomycetota bacterium]